MTEEFEPRIVAFLCNWCSYAGADSAGVARIPSPPNILPVRVMCSGRVSPEMVLRAFRAGADGVLVLGCHIGDCHYDSVGIEPERLRLDWVSAAEGGKFAQVTAEFTETVRELGPARQVMEL